MNHILAIAQAIGEYRAGQGTTGAADGGLRDFRARVDHGRRGLRRHGVEVMIQAGRGYTPTPVISHAILTHNLGRSAGLADGVVITPSHNPADDGGFQVQPAQRPGPPTPAPPR